MNDKHPHTTEEKLTCSAVNVDREAIDASLMNKLHGIPKVRLDLDQEIVVHVDPHPPLNEREVCLGGGCLRCCVSDLCQQNMSQVVVGCVRSLLCLDRHHHLRTWHTDTTALMFLSSVAKQEVREVKKNDEEI